MCLSISHYAVNQCSHILAIVYEQITYVMRFWKSRLLCIKFHVPKALFCSYINAVFKIVFELETGEAIYRLALYALLRRLKLFDYTIITYKYF